MRQNIIFFLFNMHMIISALTPPNSSMMNLRNISIYFVKSLCMAVRLKFNFEFYLNESILAFKI